MRNKRGDILPILQKQKELQGNTLKKIMPIR